MNKLEALIFCLGWAACAAGGPVWIGDEGNAAPAFEKSFAFGRPVASAELRISGLGFYEAYLNGRRIGDRELEPTPTDYTKRVYYSTYDLTREIAATNVIRVLLGNGWYNSAETGVWRFDKAPWRDFPRLWSDLAVTFADGSRTNVVTDATWSVVPSPVLFNDFREGEIIRSESRPLPPLKEPRRVQVVSAPKGRLVPETHEPARVVERVRPVAIEKFENGWILDFGKNLAGRVRMNVRGAKEGDVVSFRYDERKPPAERHIDCYIQALPSTNAWNLADAGYQTDRFICNGDAVETYAPRFTYHGFRYVLVRGLRTAPAAEDATAEFIRTGYDVESSSLLVTSDETFNRLLRAAALAYDCNFTDGFPTDCPHREKNGWLADATITATFGLYRAGTENALRDWVRLIGESQRPNGSVPCIVPDYGWEYDGHSCCNSGPGWGTALTTLPTILCRIRGERDFLVEMYSAMRRYCECLWKDLKDGLIIDGNPDWMAPKLLEPDKCWTPRTPAKLTSTAYAYRSFLETAAAADLAGRPDDATELRRRADVVKAAFNREFHKGDGVYHEGWACGQAFALNFGLVDAKDVEGARRQLVKAVHAEDDHIDFGMLGASVVFRELSKAGETALAYKMIMNTAPSFADWVRSGDTTLREDFPGKLSRNHPSFGDFAAWAYEYVLGVRAAEPGYRKFVFDPRVRGLPLTHARAKVRLAKGFASVEASWRRDAALGEIACRLVVPHGTKAEVPRLGKSLGPGVHEFTLPPESDATARWISDCADGGSVAPAGAGQAPDGIVPRWTFRYGGRAVDSAELPAAKEGAPVRIDDELVVTTEVHRFGDAIEWVNWLENTGRKDSAVITNLDDAAFLVKLPAAPRHRPGTIATPGERAVVTMQGCDVGYGITYSMDDRLSAEEFSPRIHYLRPDWGHDRLVVANRGGVSSNEMMPFFDVQGAGQGAIVAIGWTGDWRAEFTNRTEGVEVRTGLAHAGFRLRPGEKVRTSSVVVQPYGPGEDGPNKFRRLVRERYSHAVTSGGRSDACVLSVAAWGGATSEDMKRRIEAVCRAGLRFEYLWIDAGWYGRSAGDMSDGSVCDWGEFIGDWTPNTRLHPQGLADVRAAAEAAGLGMMLWFDLERVSAKSRLFAARPSWMGLAPGEGFGLVNLGDPEGWRFAVDTVDGYIRRLNLRCYRQDFNMWPAATFAHLDATKEGPERTGITEIKHIMGLYRFWDELRSRHPGLVIDNCSSGGRRLDIETMRRSVPCFRTDYLCNANSNPEVVQAHNAGISRYLPYNGCVSTVIDSYSVRSTWSSSWGVSLAVESPSADLVLLKRLCEQYRRIRGYLPMDFHNHGSATADPTAWAVWQYHDPKLKEGAVLAFRRSASPSDRCVISLKGASGLVEVEDLDTGCRTTCDASAFEVVLPQRRSSSAFIYRVVPPESDATARWISDCADGGVDVARPMVGVGVTETLPKNVIALRKRFVLKGAPASARAKVTGLGFYRLVVNGADVDPTRLMMPGWTNPGWRVLYDEYDVARWLREGTNEVRILLAPGYSDDMNPWTWRWMRPKRAWMEMEVADGDVPRRIVTDGTWEFTDDLPFVSASIYHGETYDATRAGNARWRPVVELADDSLRLEPNEGPAIRLFDPIKPVKVIRCPHGRLILDFGVNRAGVVEMRAKLPRGARVVLRHAEEISGDRLDTWTQKEARQTDVFIAAGTGEVETYRPRFTYHGFRYVEVEGLPADQAKGENFTGWGVSADVREKATFRCSDETLNWLWDTARRSMRSNFVSYPSDCCIRHERTPCLMDSQAYEDTAFQVYDIRAFYSKWLYDAARYERAVDPKVGNNDNPDWASDPITLSGRFLTYLAATNLAVREYAELKRAAESFAARSPDGLWEKGFGDWCSPAGWDFFDPGFVNSAFLVETYRTMAHLAEVKGERADAARFADLRRKAHEAFLRRHYDPKSHVFGAGRQVCFILPLALGLVPAGDVPAVVANLRRRLVGTDGGHIGTGIYGTRYFGDVLMDHGLGDEWLKAMTRKDFPGFGFMRASGATSLWEQWARDGEMNSHNHAMFAGAVSCFLTHLAGIRPAADGYSRVLVKPCFPKGLDSVEATIELPCGRFAVSWSRRGEGVDYRLSAPEDARIEFDLPPGCNLIREGVAAADTNGEWVCGYEVPCSAKAAVLVPHSVGRVQHPDWAALKPGETYIRCNPGWGMTYRMVALLNESGDSYAIVQKGAREYASFLRVRQGTKPGTVLLESGYVPDADDLRRGAVRHPFETRVIPFRGSWFAAAQAYREVVRDEPWLKAARARDFSKLREIGMWIWNRGMSGAVIPPVERFMKDAGVPVALDWYWWHRIPYDTSYPNYWPPREPEADFRAAVKRLNAAGVYCQTYMNGMMWDADDPCWADGGEQEALRQKDGSLTATAWNRFSNHRLASVCGDAPRFQAKIRALCRTLRGCGFDGQYLDCVGNSAYGACWATNHSHAAGGGGHMVKSYRCYLEAVKRGNPGLQICTEDVNETYMDTFDSVIVSASCYERFEKPGVVGFEQVPVFPAVYHGAITMFGGYATLDGIPPWDPLWPDAERWTEEKPWEELFPDQFPVEVARGVIWGLQPTVHNFKIEDATEARHRPFYDFMIATARFYHANRDLLFDGEMLSPGRLTCARQEVEFLQRGIYTKKGEYGVGRHELPTVFHSVWRAPSGRVAAVLVNWSRAPQHYKLQSEDVSSEGEIPARTWRVVR